MKEYVTYAGFMQDSDFQGTVLGRAISTSLGHLLETQILVTITTELQTQEMYS